MNPKLVIVNGYPATGKTTLSRSLAGKCKMPLLSKDQIKESLAEWVGIGDAEWSEALGAKSIHNLWEVADISLSFGRSLIIENAFVAKYARRDIENIIKNHNPKILEIYCIRDQDVRQAWAAQRPRHSIHVEKTDKMLDEELSKKYSPLGVGKLVKIDTTDQSKIDMSKLTKLIEEL